MALTINEEKTRMHTQNVNIKTAAQESTRKMGGETRAVYASAEWWAGALRSDGFVRNLNSSGEHDVISANSVLMSFFKTIGKVIEPHYDIYDYRFFCMACSYVHSLPLSHRPAFYEAAADLGFNVSDDEYERWKQTYVSVMAEISKRGY
ncbi:hypothetical protein JMT66_23260 (plasmid) [Kosakonia cowanii]|uniref:hypothetical protein n=1 Tax=Kosakonia cowanii TaxID=208223 RepID=UPI001E54AACB|nr:hypothetical protein [Kosakonia cowanii]UGS48599.1 hypothetical protein JMT66_23260 [Kosakonia cowanii]